jgi:hypothetical protein
MISKYVGSLLNTEAPTASLSFEPANGRSLEGVTTQRLAEYAFPGTQSQPITLGGVLASMITGSFQFISLENQ